MRASFEFGLGDDVDLEKLEAFLRDGCRKDYDVVVYIISAVKTHLDIQQTVSRTESVSFELVAGSVEDVIEFLKA